MAENRQITIVGGGLAGCEAAWQAARRGCLVRLHEMRPEHPTGAHVSGDLAELVCSNSLGSTLPDRASGVLKMELERCGSLLLETARATALPAGSALAVDRSLFSRLITRKLEEHPLIDVVRSEITRIPPTGIVIIASGPLTSAALEASIASLAGRENLFFFDAIAPIVQMDSIDMRTAFRASRYRQREEEGGDYINCPFSEEQYQVFIRELVSAKRIRLKPFEESVNSGVRAGAFFEGCLPIEVLAARDPQALAYGPLRPVGLRDPRTDRRPHAVAQLRQDDLAGKLYNMVGFQTNLTIPEQQRVFRLIPGLENAQFERFGQMHRNTYLAAPVLLHPTMESRLRDGLFFAGQITGVEGYLGNIGTGLLAGWNAARLSHGEPLLQLPECTMLGALCTYITQSPLATFQPMKANFGILPPLALDRRTGKRERSALYAERARDCLERYLADQNPGGNIQPS